MQCYLQIVTKTIANRLKLVLNCNVSQDQSAFVLGYLITDNARLGFEAIYKIKNLKQRSNGFCAYKVDMSEAYDKNE